MPADFLYGPGDMPSAEPVPGLNQLYLIVQDVEGLPAGTIKRHPERVNGPPMPPLAHNNELVV